MRVLLVNKFWYPKGGSERYAFLLKELLESDGHEVVPFAMADSRNVPTPWARHFAPHVEFWDSGASGRTNDVGAVQKLSTVLWNRAAAHALDALLREVRPDVAHLHNFAHQLSPSILPVLRRHRVPIVWTLHDYKLLCPNYRMYTQGAPCERCKGHSYANVIRYNCMGRMGASIAVAAEMTLHHVLTNVYADHIDTVIAPSAFLSGKLKEWGWRGRVDVVPNFITTERMRTGPAAADPQRARSTARAGGPPLRVTRTPASPVIFVGRLVEEKGIEDFLAAARMLLDVPFAVIGDGPLGPNADFRTSSTDNVTWHGPLSPDETARHIAAARILVVPSRWYENAPYVVLEAMAAGVPVIASRIGGLPELVRDGESGLLVPPRDSNALAEAIRTLYADPSRLAEMGDRAQAIARIEYGADRHVAALLAIYERVRRHA